MISATLVDSTGGSLPRYLRSTATSTMTTIVSSCSQACQPGTPSRRRLRSSWATRCRRRSPRRQAWQAHAHVVVAGYVERHGVNRCCWTCERCARGTALQLTVRCVRSMKSPRCQTTDGGECRPCLTHDTLRPPFFESDANRTQCLLRFSTFQGRTAGLLVTPTVVGLDDRMIFAMVVLSIGGVVAVTFTTGVFLAYGRVFWN